MTPLDVGTVDVRINAATDDHLDAGDLALLEHVPAGALLYRTSHDTTEREHVLELAYGQNLVEAFEALPDAEKRDLWRAFGHAIEAAAVVEADRIRGRLRMLERVTAPVVSPAGDGTLPAERDPASEGGDDVAADEDGTPAAGDPPEAEPPAPPSDPSPPAAADLPDDEPPAPTADGGIDGGALRSRVIECIANLGRPTIGAMTRELFPDYDGQIGRSKEPGKSVAAVVDALEDEHAIRRDGSYKGGVVYRLNAQTGAIEDETVRSSGVLRYLRNTGPASVMEIARHFDREPAMISTEISGLERHEPALVVKRPGGKYAAVIS